MRPRRFSISLWHLMAAVAGIAIAIRHEEVLTPRTILAMTAISVVPAAIWWLWRCCTAYHKRACLYANLEREYLWKLVEGVGDDPAWLRRCAEYYALLKARYTKALRRPWSVLEPDPPPPCRSFGADETILAAESPGNSATPPGLNDLLSLILLEIEKTR